MTGFSTFPTSLATCKVQKNLPAHPSPPSFSVCISCLLPYSDFTIWEQEAAFCVPSCVVLYRPVLIGPCKDGNYSRLGRNVSGLSLSFQRLEFSEVPHFSTAHCRRQVLNGCFCCLFVILKPMFQML